MNADADSDITREARAAVAEGCRMETRLVQAGRGIEAYLLYMRTRDVETILERGARDEDALRQATEYLRRRCRRLRRETL